LCPPKVPEKQCEQHGKASEEKMHAHVNCFLSEILAAAENRFGIVAEKKFELVGGNSAGDAMSETPGKCLRQGECGDGVTGHKAW
jgi:hypothetical protein